MTALAYGLLWMLLDDEGTMSFLFVKKQPTIEQWVSFSYTGFTHRVRLPGELA